MSRRIVASIALAGLLGLAATAAQAKTDCELRYSLSGWSVFYKTASGRGTISCDNGQSMSVNIRVKGGGLTFGKQRIDDGRGRFTSVRGIGELLGSYAQGGAHAGVGKSAGAGVVTKGDISLALAGKGEGVDIGVDFGKFVISR